MPDQFANPANPEIHRRTTAEEIWRDTGGRVDMLVAGVGTGGTITGVGEVLKARRRGFTCLAVEPADSPVLSGGAPGPHKIQGDRCRLCAGDFKYRRDRRGCTGHQPAGLDAARRLAREEGLLCGISSGAAVHAALDAAVDRKTGASGLWLFCRIRVSGI